LIKEEKANLEPSIVKHLTSRQKKPSQRGAKENQKKKRIYKEIGVPGLKKQKCQAHILQS
jgi:hypothetical protein